jgi:hypothetical protein
VSAPSLIGSIEVTKFHAQHSRLNAIHSSVPADSGVEILGGLTVISQRLYSRTQARFRGSYCAGLTKSSKILAGVKAEASHNP